MVRQMSYYRSISWSAAVRELRVDRVQMTSDERRRLLRRETFIKIAVERARLGMRTSPVVVMGRYDRRAIMCTALATAKARHAGTGEPWRLCLSDALKGTWLVAKGARLSAIPHQHKVPPWISKPLQRSVGTTQISKTPYRRPVLHEASRSQALCSLPRRLYRKPAPPLLSAPVSTPPVSC